MQEFAKGHDYLYSMVDNTTPDGSIFASLGYIHSGLEIGIIQVADDDNGYRFEALPSNGKFFINDGISYEETLMLVKEFFKQPKSCWL